MEKLLTIVVPVYNTEKYLSKCLNSLIVPKHLERLEVLIVIDGSPDNSEKIARQFESKYPRTFIVIQKENGGHGSTINKGLELATGKYFRVLDSDDWFDEVNFETFLDRLQFANEDVVMTHIMREYTSIGKSLIWGNDTINYDYRYTEFSILKRLAGEFFAMGRCTYKTDKLKENHLQLLEKRSFEEAIFHVFPLIFMNSFIFYDMVVYHYYLERPDQSVKQKVTIKQSNDWKALIEQIIAFFMDHQKELDAERKDFILRTLKMYADNEYLTMNALPFHVAQKELKEYHAYLKSLPIYDYLRGKHGRTYAAMPYFLFRLTRAIYVRSVTAWKK